MTEHDKPSPSRKALRFTKRDLMRTIEGAKRAGLTITSLRIEPDGSINVLTGGTPEVAASSSNPWDGE